MTKLITLSRYKFGDGTIQHNVVMHVSALFDDSELIETRLKGSNALLESVYPANITIKSLEARLNPLPLEANAIRALKTLNRGTIFNEGDEISIDQLNDLLVYCYSNNFAVELDIFDIKNKHLTFVANKDTVGHHYLYGPIESINKEYIDRCKKKLPGWVFGGSFRKTL